MNTLGNGKRGHLCSVPSGLKLPFDRKAGRFARSNCSTRMFGLRHRSAALSPASLIMWRLISHGTRPGRAHGLLTAWSGWEHLSHYLWPSTDIPAAPYRLLGLRVRPYAGQSFVLSDGIKIEAGALIGELHCNNQNILRLVSEYGLNPFAATREDLRSLAAWIGQDEHGRQIRALYGVTMLTKGALRLGFTVRRQPVNIRRRFEKIFMTGLLFLYAAEGVQRLMNGTTPRVYPQEVWISRRELIKRYGVRPARMLEAGNRRAAFSTLPMS